MTDSEKVNLTIIVDLINGGEEKEAYELLKEVLIQNPENLDGWSLLLKIAPTEKERLFAQHRIKHLSSRSRKESVV